MKKYTVTKSNADVLDLTYLEICSTFEEGRSEEYKEESKTYGYTHIPTDEFWSEEMLTIEGDDGVIYIITNAEEFEKFLVDEEDYA